MFCYNCGTKLDEGSRFCAECGCRQDDAAQQDAGVPMPVITPEVNPVITPEVNPVITPEVNPVITPEVNPVINPAAEPAFNPEPVVTPLTGLNDTSAPAQFQFITADSAMPGVAENITQLPGSTIPGVSDNITPFPGSAIPEAPDWMTPIPGLDDIDNTFADDTQIQNAGAVNNNKAESNGNFKNFIGTKKGKIILGIVAGLVVLAAAAAILIPILIRHNAAQSQSYEVLMDENGDCYYVDENGDNVYLNDIVSSSDSSGGDMVEQPAETRPAREYNIRWLINPQIEAEDIDVLYCAETPTNDYRRYDYNSIGMHKYDRISLIKRDGTYGMIIYNGGVVTGVDFKVISVGYEQDYLLTTSKDGSPIYYTFTPLYELKKLTSSEAYQIAADGFMDQPVWVEDEGLYVDSNGDFYPWEEDGRTISNLMAVPWISKQANTGWVDASDASGWVLVKNGELIDGIVYEDAGCFSDGVVPVKLGGKWGYVNENGERIIECAYEACWNTPDGMKPYNASDGYIVVYSRGQYAMYDTYGEPVILFGQYERIRPVYEGMCWVRYNGKWGVLGIEDDAVADRAIKPDRMVSEYTTRVDSGNGLRMREGPGTSYCVIDMLSNNKKVIVCGVTGEWSYVRVNGVYGWVKTEYLD